MQLSFRNYNYKATLSQPTTNQHVIANPIEPNNLLTSNHPILKCFTSKAIIRPSFGEDGNYDDDYRNNEELTASDRDDEELTIFDEDDEELTEFVEDSEAFTEFVEDSEEFIIFNEEDFTPFENTENPACSTVLNGENTAPDPVLTHDGTARGPFPKQENTALDPVLTSHDEPATDDDNRSTTATFCGQNPDKVSSSCQQCSYWAKVTQVTRGRSFRNTMM